MGRSLVETLAMDQKKQTKMYIRSGNQSQGHYKVNMMYIENVEAILPHEHPKRETVKITFL